MSLNRYCTKCGKIISTETSPQDSKFCVYCGNSFTDQNITQKKQKKFPYNLTSLQLIILGLGSFFVLCLIAFFFIGFLGIMISPPNKSNKESYNYSKNENKKDETQENVKNYSNNDIETSKKEVLSDKINIAIFNIKSICKQDLGLFNYYINKYESDYPPNNPQNYNMLKEVGNGYIDMIYKDYDMIETFENFLRSENFNFWKLYSENDKPVIDDFYDNMIDYIKNSIEYSYNQDDSYLEARNKNLDLVKVYYNKISF